MNISRDGIRQIRSALATASGAELLQQLPFVAAPLRLLERHPTAHGAVLSTFGLRRPIFIDHRSEPRSRFGHGRPAQPALHAMISRDHDRYARRLDTVASQIPHLSAIPVRADLDGADPYWANGWLPPADAAALYGFVAVGHPARYLEIGSGNSTKVVRRAISDHALRTRVTSIDPALRAGIDPLCDRIIRRPLQDSDLTLFDTLEAGDIVFFDGSHRAFMGSDVTVFFLEVLPRLRSGVLVHIHDVWLPADYPPAWRWRHYSEQYVLAAYLLGGASNLVVELPNAYVAGVPELASRLQPLWTGLGLTNRLAPTSFWLSVR
jgi:hypothetical protein